MKDKALEEALGFADELKQIMIKRHESYGAPNEFHEDIAKVLAEQSQSKYRTVPVDEFTKEDVVTFMMQYKLNRWKHTGNLDDLLDIAGYAAIAYGYAKEKDD